MAWVLSQAEAAFDTVVECLEHFEALDDPWQAGMVSYPLDEELVLCPPGVLAGANSRVEIAAYSRKKLDYLRPDPAVFLKPKRSVKSE